MDSIDLLHQQRLDFLNKIKDENSKEYLDFQKLKSENNFYFVEVPGSKPWFDLFIKSRV